MHGCVFICMCLCACPHEVNLKDVSFEIVNVILQG